MPFPNILAASWLHAGQRISRKISLPELAPEGGFKIVSTPSHASVHVTRELVIDEGEQSFEIEIHAQEVQEPVFAKVDSFALSNSGTVVSTSLTWLVIALPQGATIPPFLTAQTSAAYGPTGNSNTATTEGPMQTWPPGWADHDERQRLLRANRT